MTMTTKQLEVILHYDLQKPGAFAEAVEGKQHVWLCDLDVVSPNKIAPQAALSVHELTRADRLPSGILKDRFVRSRQVLRILLAESLNLAPEEIEFEFGPWGKPAVANQAAASNRDGLYFSLAHAEQWLAVALSRGCDLGVDLEIIRQDIDPLPLARTHFSPREVAELKLFPLPVQRERFYQLWTLKEASLKAKGVGIASGAHLPDVAFQSGCWDWHRQIQLGKDIMHLALARNSSAKKRYPPVAMRATRL